MPRRIVTPFGSPQGDGWVKLSAFPFLLGIFSLSFMFYVFNLLRDSSDAYERSFAQFALYQALFATAGVVFMIIQARGFGFRKMFMTYPIWAIIWMGITLISSVSIEMILRGTIVRSSISTTILAMYYIFAGACEELFFRGFLLRSFLTGTFNMENRYLKWAINGVGLIISSLAFMWAHEAAYGQEPYLMWTQFGSGIAWGLIYWWNYDEKSPPGSYRTGDLLPLILGHMLKNFMALPAVLVTR